VAAANLLVIGGVAGCGGRSGGVGEGDGEPERFELADVVAGFFVFAGAAGVIADAEFAMAGGAAGESGSDVSSKWPAGQTVAKIIEIWPRSLRPYKVAGQPRAMSTKRL